MWMKAYQELGDKWDLEPDWKLIEYQHLIPKGPVLDLGMGNGRNALFFAKMGYEVEGVDISKTLVKRCRERANVENLNLTAHIEDVRNFDIPKRRYSLIIVSKILQLFRKSDIESIVEKIYLGLAKRGLVYVYTFSVEEYEFARDKEGFELVEDGTYYYSKWRMHFHYFTRDELLALFRKLKMLYYVEGLRRDISKRKSRVNAIIEYIGQKIR